jgi:hypothetical protein
MEEWEIYIDIFTVFKLMKHMTVYMKQTVKWLGKL